MTNKMNFLKEVFNKYKDNYERRGNGHLRIFADVQT